ncbi:hypothetical protein GJ496_004801 [Pomphorhynchus laevis]|nr:hypothetical protein GJ496_004801 [Pomphorhynchus laevis]
MKFWSIVANTILLAINYFALGLQDSTSDVNNQSVTEHEQFKIADNLYHEGLSYINGTKRIYSSAIKAFSKAADLGHNGAKMQMAIAYLFGEYLSFDFNQAYLIFKEIADSSGDSQAQFYLGFMHANGLGFNSSQFKALVYYTYAAASGDPFGNMALGYRYLKLTNIVGGCNDALPLYSSVADDVASTIKMSNGPVVHKIRLSDEGDSPSLKSGVIVDDEVVQYYQLLAERGDFTAQLGLGELFYSGKRGTKSNFKRALYYFGKATDAGSITAVSYMGRIYAQGDENVPQNTGKALRLLRHAAEKGDALGQSSLGLMYYHGIGVKKDFETARKYFTLSADQKNTEAFLWLGIMNYNGEGVKKDLRIAVEYFTLATQGGHVLGPYYLATINSYGPGILRQCDTSADLFKTVAERGKWATTFMDAYYDYKQGKHNHAFLKYLLLSELGYEDAQLNAAYLLDNGLVNLFENTDSMKRTFALYQRAASQGNSFARVRLGDFYYYGNGGVDNDFEAAVSQYKVAADSHGNAQALFNLGYMYEKGLGLRKDLHLAKRFYDKASIASSEAILPTSLALFKLRLHFLHDQLLQYSPFKRTVILLKEMRALRIGTLISGLLIFLLFFWQRFF